MHPMRTRWMMLLTAGILFLTVLPLSADTDEALHCWPDDPDTVVDGDGQPVDDARADRTDIVEHCLHYDTAEMAFMVRVAEPGAPIDDPAWRRDHTVIQWDVEQVGGSGADLTVTFRLVADNLDARITDAGGRVCDGVGELRDDFAVASLPAGCPEGDPDLRVRAAAHYESEGGDRWSEYAPGPEEFTDPVEKHRDAGEVPDVPDRFSGADRFETAASVSEAYFDPGIDVAYVATGHDYPDALAGGVLAALDQGPVLLVASDDVPAPTASELQRLEPSRIVALGGSAVVSDAVMDQLGEYADTVTRLAGENRFATAVEISQQAFDPDPTFHTTAFVATGANFADALSGVPPAALHEGPILLAT